jgi:hypothetical protein
MSPNPYSYSQEDEAQYWVPLVGFLPKAVFLVRRAFQHCINFVTLPISQKDENGKKAADAIYASLTSNDNRTTVDTLEPMLLQVNLTIVSSCTFISAVRHLSSVTSARTTKSLD